MTAWPYESLPTAAVFTSVRVLDQTAPVVRLVRDGDGDWQALDPEARSEGDARVLALSSLLELHPDLGPAVEALDERPWGWHAVRGYQPGDWVLEPHVLSS